ncbi:MAG: proline--tRNA ligase [Thermoplasmatales archaeon]
MEGEFEDDFSVWYNNIIEKVGLTDKRYPVKGLNVWPPYGWALMLNIDKVIREKFQEKNYKEVNFPTLIPKSQFDKEEEHIKGFSNEVYWVTRGGSSELEEKLVLRPTSETAMYPVFSLWIRSHSDLPLRIFQIVNTFRYETKQTRTFIRVREIHFIEGHTCHADFEDSEKQIADNVEIWKGIADSISIPYTIVRRPDWDKFPGAYYTLGVDTFLPSGRSLQIATIHQYRDNFSRAYNIMYADQNGERRYVHQTTFGISERLIAAIVGIHGDGKGLILPPSVAPVQVVIVPIPGEGVLEYAMEVLALLRSKGIRAELDDREQYTPGWKFNDWEEKGVPIRLDIGKKELASRSVTISLRTGGKKNVRLSSLTMSLRRSFSEVNQTLYRRAEEKMRNYLQEINDLGKGSGSGPNLVYWCGKKGCADQIEKTGKSILGSLDDVGNCIVCGSKGKKTIISRKY